MSQAPSTSAASSDLIVKLVDNLKDDQINRVDRSRLVAEIWKAGDGSPQDAIYRLMDSWARASGERKFLAGIKEIWDAGWGRNPEQVLNLVLEALRKDNLDSDCEIRIAAADWLQLNSRKLEISSLPVVFSALLERTGEDNQEVRESAQRAIANLWDAHWEANQAVVLQMVRSGLEVNTTVHDWETRQQAALWLMDHAVEIQENAIEEVLSALIDQAGGEDDVDARASSLNAIWNICEANLGEHPGIIVAVVVQGLSQGEREYDWEIRQGFAQWVRDHAGEIKKNDNHALAILDALILRAVDVDVDVRMSAMNAIMALLPRGAKGMTLLTQVKDWQSSLPNFFHPTASKDERNTQVQFLSLFMDLMDLGEEPEFANGIIDKLWENSSSLDTDTEIVDWINIIRKVKILNMQLFKKAVDFLDGYIGEDTEESIHEKETAVIALGRLALYENEKSRALKILVEMADQSDPQLRADALESIEMLFPDLTGEGDNLDIDDILGARWDKNLAAFLHGEDCDDVTHQSIEQISEKLKVEDRRQLIDAVWDIAEDIPEDHFENYLCLYDRLSKEVDGTSEKLSAKILSLPEKVNHRKWIAFLGRDCSQLDLLNEITPEVKGQWAAFIDLLLWGLNHTDHYHHLEEAIGWLEKNVKILADDDLNYTDIMTGLQRFCQQSGIEEHWVNNARIILANLQQIRSKRKVPKLMSVLESAQSSEDEKADAIRELVELDTRGSIGKLVEVWVGWIHAGTEPQNVEITAEAIRSHSFAILPMVDNLVKENRPESDHKVQRQNFLDAWKRLKAVGGEDQEMEDYAAAPVGLVESAQEAGRERVRVRIARQLSEMSDPRFFEFPRQRETYDKIHSELGKHAVPVLVRMLPVEKEIEILEYIVKTLGYSREREAIDALSQAVNGEERIRNARKRLLEEYYLKPSSVQSEQAATILDQAIGESKRTLRILQFLNITVFAVGLGLLFFGLLFSMLGGDTASRVAGALAALGGLSGIVVQLVREPMTRIQNAMANLVQMETTFTNFIWELNLNGTYIQSQYVNQGILEDKDVAWTIERIEGAMEATMDLVSIYTEEGGQRLVTRLNSLSPASGVPGSQVTLFGQHLLGDSSQKKERAGLVAIDHKPIDPQNLSWKERSVSFDLPMEASEGEDTIWISLYVDGMETNALPFKPIHKANPAPATHGD